MNSSALTGVLMISLLLNLFVFVAQNELIEGGITYNTDNQPLSNYVDVNNPNSLDAGDGVPVNINEQSSGISSGLGFVDWLAKIWGWVTGVFRYFFSVYYLMLDMGINQGLAYLFGLPIAFAQIIGIFAFIRGVSS